MFMDMDMAMTRTIEDGYRGYHSDSERPDSYYKELEESEGVSYAQMAKLKDRATALYDKRWQAACEVIDLVTSRVGVNATELGLYLYGVTWDYNAKTASSPLVDKIDEWFDKSGDKVKMKKQLSELEKENTLLREMLRKG